MKEYRVTLISKDGHRFETITYSDTDNGAVEIAFDLIGNKGWDVYKYKLEQLERIS